MLPIVITTERFIKAPAAAYRPPLAIFHPKECLIRILAELLPAGIKVCIVADRGFGDQKLYKMLTEELYFDYVIRFRGNIAVTDACGETRSAATWVRAGGRARVLRGAAVTADRYPVATVVCVQDPDMKQAWCLAASSTDATAKQLTSLYGRRWGIECTLRDMTLACRSPAQFYGLPNAQQPRAGTS